MKLTSLCLALLLPSLCTSPLHATDTLTIRADQPGAAVSPTLYGAFFEDINRAGDGGLYAEMVQNRSFEDFPDRPLAWTTLENPTARYVITLDRSQPLNAKNPTSLKLQVDSISGGRVGLYNQGFKGGPEYPRDQPAQWLPKFEAALKTPVNGLPVEAGKRYELSLYARAAGAKGAVTVSLESQAGKILAAHEFTGLGTGWQKFAAELSPGATDTDARLVLSVHQPGTLWLDMVSLFPKDTYKGRPNGLRPDLVNMMAAMHPGLLRFPGGSFSEGHVLADAWHWKDTIGDVAERPGTWNIWGYRSTNGLGFHEYLQLAEDLGAEPLYVAHVGMAEKDFVPVAELEPWIQDTLDAIEYANGPVTSKWGALRAKNGHPQPFHLKYVEIGNENGMGYSWGGGTRADYLPRYTLFYNRIKTAHPEITTIANIHPEPDAPADVVDEHYYPLSDWFFQQASRYDHYDRSKPKLYLGEYAVKKDGGHGNLRAALAEAAFLTGLERNADVVAMSSYAPLFTNPPWERWKPDAITFDPTRAYGSPSYYVQVMLASNRPDVVLPVELPPSSSTPPEWFAVAGMKKDSGDLILKVVNRGGQSKSLAVQIQGATGDFSKGTCTVLNSADPNDENSFAEPTKIATKTSPISANPAGVHEFPAYSVSILRWSRK
ncbi:MAG: alpha-L-arabinofuranosidase C-terminal domain-containing protein [Chthoniobacteraceae bacterium]